MKWMRQQSKYENIGYVVLWGLLFAAPLLSLYIRTANNSEMTFDWQEVWLVWRRFGIYLLLFLVHNFILAPLLVYRHKRVLYVALAACLLGVFTAYQCNRRPDDFKGPHMARHDRMPHGDDHGGPPEEFFDHKPPHDEDDTFAGDDARHRLPRDDRHKEFRQGKHVPPGFIAERDIVVFAIIILMWGMNIGVKIYFKTRDDQKKLVALEKENLEQQLQYLKYQINPHFFMNTLNNIHALVDIDPEKAKDTILELSKMMRFVLYEGDKHGVPLSREFDFIRHYMTLMKLRFTNRVRITVDLPGEAPDCQIPPLMLITFIENAFKHGISYQRDSFIDVKAEIMEGGQALHFTCRNSKAEKPNQEKGGVGLANVKQRLNLLYDNRYTLNILDEADTYNVELTIPLIQSDKQNT